MNLSTQPRAKVLLVDDLEQNLVALAALLDVDHDDVEVLTARSGAAALELLLVHDVALALIDVHMPELDGFELAELMRGSQRTRQVPIIFVTAGARDQRRIFKGYETGAVDFLNKPIEPNILRSKAGVFFQLYRQKQQLAQELQQRTERLRLNELFTAVLGHDLRNPLSAILTSAQLLQRVSTDQNVQQAAARMLSSGRRMNRLIEDILDLSRSRLGTGIPVQRENADLGPLLQRVVREHQTAHPERAIDVVISGNLQGAWDVERFAQVASNLVGNAIQHGEPGQAVEVMLDGADDHSVEMRIRNAGTIPPELLPHLFDPFRGSERKSEGLGLGLYIVQQIVKAHRGSVAVNSDTSGTEFRVTLPRA